MAFSIISTKHPTVHVVIITFLYTLGEFFFQRRLKPVLTEALTCLGLLDMFHQLSSVDSRIMEVPPASSSLTELHLLEAGGNLEHSWRTNRTN